MAKNLIVERLRGKMEAIYFIDKLETDSTYLARKQ